MRHLGYLIGLSTLAAPAVAQQATVGSFEVVEAGIYTRDVISSAVDANGVSQNVVSNPRLTSSTTRIPAKLGVSFGIWFKVEGSPDRTVVSIRKNTHYPSPGGRPPGRNAPLLVNSSSIDVALNTVSFTGYTLAEPWELIPGKWVFSFWLEDRKLGEQEFTLVAVGVMPSSALAYFLRKKDRVSGCAQDGSACDVWCAKTEEIIGKWLAGTMYWNGSVWSDGVRTDANPYVVASAITQAAGTACDQFEG